MDLRMYEGKIDDAKILYLDSLKLPAESFTFYFEGGLMSLVRHLNHGEKPMHDKIFMWKKRRKGLLWKAPCSTLKKLT